MENEDIPILLFDNHCYACMKFIKIIDFFAHGKFLIVGHYSNFGLKIREDYLDESALEMFWLINKKKAFGGRAALIPVIKVMLSKKIKEIPIMGIEKECQQGCKTIKEIVKRTTSVFSNSKILKIRE
jgi:hypothetical protein